MIDFDETSIVAVRRTGDGERFALFTNADVQAFWTQKFWVAILDTGGDGFGLPVRYGTVCSAPAGWTLRQLILVAQARAALEYGRVPEGGALAVLEALGKAVRQMQAGEPLGAGVEFCPGAVTSPYSWTKARSGDLAIELCPDPESRREGIVPEQILIVVDEALRDWAERAPYLSRLWTCRNAVREALAAEIRRVRLARLAAGEAGEGR
ncbi:hypothetical protein [Acidocella sp. MX-AZ02]|uniref:hypothetical protein n=1 Tax=Acidocella sp. MX-AZ02 TaxID=1214225 RepID=UPI00028DC131|nr:hypothetical protein [Acidocella sp. MX-AZ02]EKM99419.1 hypothetical protein MXAZACID_10528 [Acidocella sp. MX-AZ02]